MEPQEPADHQEQDRSRLTRRHFLAGLGLVGGTALAAGLLREMGDWPFPRKRFHVIVLGAGLAGLCAAFELERIGHSVTILEAEKDHIGGRVRTASFGDGLYGELGAMRIPRDHLLVHHYIRLFGLPLRPFVEFNPNAYYMVGGQRRRIRDVTRLDLRYAVQGIGWGAHSIWKQPFFEIPGGMARLPAAFAGQLRSRPQMGCEVVRLERDAVGRRAAAIYLYQGERRRVDGDFILCTLPFPALQPIEIDPPFTTNKAAAIRELKYASASKTLIAANRRFWESDDGIFGGATYTDLPTGTTYYPSDNAAERDPYISAGPGVLLGSYTLAAGAETLDRLAPGDPSPLVLNCLAQEHPQLTRPETVRQVLSWNWDHHPWSRGAFALVDEAERWRRAAAASEGRIYFAGEHTSGTPTWMQGALESALRAVREIVVAGQPDT